MSFWTWKVEVSILFGLASWSFFCCRSERVLGWNSSLCFYSTSTQTTFFQKLRLGAGPNRLKVLSMFSSEDYMRYCKVDIGVFFIHQNLLLILWKLSSDICIYQSAPCLLLFFCFLQVEGAFVQGIGFFVNEEHLSNSDGVVLTDGTWTYKPPTVDTIPKQLNVEFFNSGHHQKRVLSSKGIVDCLPVLAFSFSLEKCI